MYYRHKIIIHTHSLYLLTPIFLCSCHVDKPLLSTLPTQHKQLISLNYLR